MNRAVNHEKSSFLRLFRFLAWYGVAIAALFLVLPLAVELFENSYDALSRSARFFSILGFFLVVAVWQVLRTRDRWRSRVPAKTGSQLPE